ncbi:tetratricopeptide repeat protein [Desulfococcaceae bacterium HSG8]|nr:tetratricopeptide repeat protein [Desulfococcaceae bacterium HSG8]
MTQDQRELYRSRISTQEFLFSKTDSIVRDDASDALTLSLLKEGAAALSIEFPDMLTGKAFIRDAMRKLEASSAFGGMTIRIDAFPGISDKRYALNLLIDTAKAVDGVCDSEETGMWGLVGRDMFGCFFPGKDESACLKLAARVRKNLAHRKGSVSIGAAIYPLLHFKKEQILLNARKALDHAAFFGPGSIVAFDAVSLNISGDKLYQKGNVHGAIEEFRTALLLAPSDVNVHNSLGVCYGVLGSYKKSLEEFELAVRLDPGEVMALYNAGFVNMLMSNRGKALEYFSEAEKAGEDVFEVAFQTGRIYLEMKKFPSSREYLEKAVELRPESGPAFRYLGECYAAMNMANEAIQAYKKAIRQNPYDASSLSAIGCLFDIQGENPDISTVFCQHSVEIMPENGLYRHRLGMLYMKQKRLEEALEEFIKAAELGHSDSTRFIKKIRKRLTDDES